MPSLEVFLVQEIRQDKFLILRPATGSHFRVLNPLNRGFDSYVVVISMM